MTRLVTRVDPGTGETLKEHVEASVGDCSLSIAVDEGQLSNEKGGQIAQEFMGRMGFTEVSGKAACRWVAVHHGLRMLPLALRLIAWVRVLGGACISFGVPRVAGSRNETGNLPA
ncbi:hypothetical protein [Microbacterium enclense]|uniref:hypothetical protein n=1 Tax=Microbacterium enclense TaxID=993073 RepID=UPI003F7CD4C9